MLTTYVPVRQRRHRDDEVGDNHWQSSVQSFLCHPSCWIMLGKALLKTSFLSLPRQCHLYKPPVRRFCRHFIFLRHSLNRISTILSSSCVATSIVSRIVQGDPVGICRLRLVNSESLSLNDLNVSWPSQRSSSIPVGFEGGWRWVEERLWVF